MEKGWFWVQLTIKKRQEKIRQCNVYAIQHKLALVWQNVVLISAGWNIFALPKSQNIGFDFYQNRKFLWSHISKTFCLWCLKGYTDNERVLHKRRVELLIYFILYMNTYVHWRPKAMVLIINRPISIVNSDLFQWFKMLAAFCRTYKSTLKNAIFFCRPAKIISDHFLP